MRDPSTIPDAPPPEIKFSRKVGAFSSAAELWRRRESIRSLAERDFRARYKQAVLGVSWAVIQPLLLVVIFTFTIRRIATIHTQGAPYALFSYVGLVTWGFFSGSVTWAANCLVGNQPLLNKVNCPREAFPAAAVMLAAIDAVVSLSGLVVYFFIYRFVPRATIYLVPMYLAVATIFAFGVSLVVSVSVVYLRDLRQIIPIAIQIGLFVTPVAYDITSRLPVDLRLPYCALNPMAPVIDGLRRAVLLGQGPQWNYLGAGAAAAMVWLVVGVKVFKWLEIGIADII